MQNCTHNKIYDRAADGRHFKTYFDQEVIKIKYTGMSVRYQTAGPPNKADLRKILRSNRAIFPFPALCAALVPKLRFGVNCGMASPWWTCQMTAQALRSHLTGPPKKPQGAFAPVAFLVDLRRIELRSYKVRLRTLHA